MGTKQTAGVRMSRAKETLFRTLWIACLIGLTGLALAVTGWAQETVADGEISVNGTVAGSYLDTWAGDGVYEAIREVESGGKPSKRTSLLEHKWTFDVPPGDAVTLFIEAYHTANEEGDDFDLAWSTDDVNYTHLLTITETIGDGTPQFADLAPGASGRVYVRALDLGRGRGHRVLDTLYVDHLYIESASATGPPTPPSALEVHVDKTAGHDGLLLTWSDNSGNEDGFRIERSPDGLQWDPLVSVGTGVTSYPDTGLLPDTMYFYVVLAFNGEGDSAWSNVDSATTLPPMTFTLELVDPAGGGYPSIAYDPSGNPGIGYTAGGDIKFARWNGFGWDIDVVSAGVDTRSIAVAFFPDGRPCLVYEDLVFAEKIGGVWVLEGIGPRAKNNDISLAVDPDGNPAVAYNARRNKKPPKEPAGLWLTRRVEGEWMVDLVDEGEDEYHAHKSLKFDLEGHPAIAYWGPGPVMSTWEDDELRLARWNGASWDIEILVGYTYGLDVHLAFDPITGWPAMVHAKSDPLVRGLELIRWNGSGWLYETILPEDLGCALDLEFTSQGIPYFGYQRYTGSHDFGGIWTVHWEGGGWLHELVTPWYVGNGFEWALALDGNERPGVAWGNADGLMFAHKQDP